MQREITDDLDALLAVLPPTIAEALREVNTTSDLLEVIMDLGRLPESRFLAREVILSDKEVTRKDLDDVASRIGDFGDDNRAGIERTLHRISAIRNRKGRIVGLTLRVGRAVYGTIDIIQDIIESGQSCLLLGRPGVGKTTMLREVARVLGETKRVVIVDTSNEIGGDGDIPHPAIGRARRMQVITPNMQHAVMIEAVENHMPEVIVIDEIGTELEAAAARTIAERGVQLIGTAHGNTLDNLMLNPTLSDLVGGIQSVTLGDEEARRRGTQKSVLERKAPPTFDVVIEIQDWDRLVVRHNVAESVDAILRGRPLRPEIRYRDAAGKVRIEQGDVGPATFEVERPAEMHVYGGGYRESYQEPRREPYRARSREAYRESSREAYPEPAREPSRGAEPAAERRRDMSMAAPGGETTPRFVVAPTRDSSQPFRIFPYGINKNRLRQASRELSVSVVITSEPNEADAIFTLRSHYRRRPAVLSDAEERGIPIYVLRSNTAIQMQRYLAEIFGLRADMDPYAMAMQEAESAISQIMSGAEHVDLAPQNAYIRRKQHEMARRSNLLSRSSGKDPRRHVRIYQDARLAP